MLHLYQKIFLSLSIFVTLAAFLPVHVNADIMNPDFLTLKCKLGEKEVVCSFSSKEPGGPRTTDECKKYKKDSNYYYLVGHGSSFGGKEKYCLKVGAPENTNQDVLVGGVILGIVGISLVALFLIRKRNVTK